MPRPIIASPFIVGASLVALLLVAPQGARAQAVEAFNPGANQQVVTVAVQPDGKTVYGGMFTALGGGTGTTTRNHIGRLNTDGTVDASFNPGANGDVYAVAVQADGKILFGGNFTSIGGGTGLTTVRHHIARVHGDGTVDATFNPGANLNVYALAVQADGKILVGGNFSGLGGGTGTTARTAIGRLNADGSVDTFNPGASKSAGVPIVYTMALQTDGKVVLGGYFNGLGGGTGATVRNFIGRVDGNGVVDSFNPGASSISGVNALAIQADGKIVVGGSFVGLGGGTGATTRQNIGRVHSDGLVDTSFNPGAESQVLTLAIQTDGKILAGGYFQLLGAGTGAGVARKYIGRITSGGSVDSTFNPGAGNLVNALAVQPDGAVVVGGVFLTLGGGTGTTTARARIGRITNPDAAVEVLNLSNGQTVLTWARSGGSPEVSRVTVEMSTGGAYTMVGHAARIAGGWELNGLTIPANARVFLRARGYYSSGHQNGSGSIVESIISNGVSTFGDFDGDGRADVGVYRPSNGTWYTLHSTTSSLSARNWGSGTDIPVPADYDGDGKADIAVYRPSTGTWYILRSGDLSVSAVPWGAVGDVPIPSDYDGDGKTDIAIFRPSNGTWYILRSNTMTGLIITFGVSTDIPVPGDYDGDGMSDIAVYRPDGGNWFIYRSSQGMLIYQWGVGNDRPVVADYDGDGKSDIAVFRPGSGTWYIVQSSTATGLIAQWGISTDVPVPADYDGDGKSDITIYRPSTGSWYIFQSGTSTVFSLVWGTGGDIPVLARP